MSKLVRAAALTSGTLLLYGLLEPYRLVVRRFTVTLPGLPPEADGLRLVQLSDLHCSAITSPRMVERAVALCNAQMPDVVVLTGDYVSRRNSYLLPTLARLWARPIMDYARDMATAVAQLRAPEGIFAVPGNHDHSRQSFVAIEKLLHAAGVTTLVNRSVRLRGVLPLVGLDDLRGGRPELRAACRGVPADEPHLILSHNPRLIWAVTNRRCLMLAGHTHGGQVHPPFTSFRRRPRDMRGTGWHEGWYEHGAARLYISAGVGSVHFPLRFRCPPEIAVFTLRAER